MPRPEPTPITRTESGEEQHESWGAVVVLRSTGSARLFQSNIPHQHYVTLRIAGATRQRDLHTDYVHPALREHIEVTLSAAQWANMISSFGLGEGTPCTISRLGGRLVPEAADDEPRLQRTSREVADAARVSTEAMRAASQAVADGYARKAGRVEMGQLIAALQHAAGGVPSTMKFAADMLTEHAEQVVSQTRADIEAATTMAAYRSLAATSAPTPQELTP